MFILFVVETWYKYFIFFAAKARPMFVSMDMTQAVCSICVLSTECYPLVDLRYGLWKAFSADKYKSEVQVHHA